MINIILILLLVLFGYSLIPGRIPESWKNPVLVGLLFCAIATITCSFFFAKRKDAMFVSAEYPVSVGYMLGKQVRSDIKKRGEVVAVLSDKAKWASDRYLEGLQKALTGS